MCLNRMASMESNKSDFGDAIKLYRRVVALDPQDPWAWHNLSWIYLEQGDLDNAEECNARALAIMDFGMARLIQRDIRAERNEANKKLPSIWGRIKDNLLG